MEPFVTGIEPSISQMDFPKVKYFKNMISLSTDLWSYERWKLLFMTYIKKTNKKQTKPFNPNQISFSYFIFYQNLLTQILLAIILTLQYTHIHLISMMI